MIKPEGREFNSHPGQRFPLSLSMCGPNSISRANAHMVYGLKHQHFTLHSITLFVLKDGAYYCYCAYVLRISRYSDFLSPVLSNTGIFLRGLKVSGERRS